MAADRGGLERLKPRTHTHTHSLFSVFNPHFSVSSQLMSTMTCWHHSITQPPLLPSLSSKMAPTDWLSSWRTPLLLLLLILTFCFSSESASTTPFPKDLEAINVVNSEREQSLSDWVMMTTAVISVCPLWVVSCLVKGSYYCKLIFSPSLFVLDTFTAHMSFISSVAFSLFVWLNVSI